MVDWKDRFDGMSKEFPSDSQKRVGRTKGGKSIDAETWSRTVDYVREIVGLKKSDAILELCCGNGLLVGELAQHCAKALGVDFSEPLLEECQLRYKDKVTTLLSDANEIEQPQGSLDVVIIYFSIQYFSERESFLLIEKSLNWLKAGGRLLIGDIPDMAKKWSYLNRPEYRRDYYLRLKEDNLMIGHWFQKEFFSRLNDVFQDIEVKVSDQPGYQINSDIRFDVLITKGSR